MQNVLEFGTVHRNGSDSVAIFIVLNFESLSSKIVATHSSNLRLDIMKNDESQTHQAR
jgi:hypothetical protein